MDGDEILGNFGCKNLEASLEAYPSTVKYILSLHLTLVLPTVWSQWICIDTKSPKVHSLRPELTNSLDTQLSQTILNNDNRMRSYRNNK